MPFMPIKYIFVIFLPNMVINYRIIYIMANLNPSIFRAYDVRGIYPEEINEDATFRIGGALVRHLGAKNLVVGEDARLSSPSLSKAVIEGITSAGCDVTYLGICTTPLFYFSVNRLRADGGIMVTGSHTPPQYNGLKIVREESVPIFSESGLPEIQKLAAEAEIPEESPAKGKIRKVDLLKKYLEFLLASSGFQSNEDREALKNFNFVIDAGNGVAPLVLNGLLKNFNFNFTPLYFNIDGSFPNHFSDISREENIQDLKSKVRESKSDFGVAFDGDGDRLAVVDVNGERVKADKILSLLFKYNIYGGGKVAYDHRFSKAAKELFGKKGFQSRTGHSFIKNVMKKNDADVGGELSGHFFFKEMLYADSAALTMLKLLKILSIEKKPLDELVKPFGKYFDSGEINLETRDKVQAVSIIEKLKEKYKYGNVEERDGVTIDFWNKEGWWFNLRPSNTEPLVRLVAEAKTKNLLVEKVRELTGLIKSFL